MTPSQLYLDLIKRTLTRTVLGTHSLVAHNGPNRHRGFAARMLYVLVKRILDKRNLVIARRVPNDQREDEGGKHWPPPGDTIMGITRLQNLEDCILDVLRHDVPGDFIETGVYRGGACIFMRAILAAYGDRGRVVWVADSFCGAPPLHPQYPQDCQGRPTPADVAANFERYGLLDHRVVFLPGWFKDTLPVAPINQLAILRLDGDMYSSTMDALQALYHKVSPGGYVIVDDYGSHPTECGRAVREFRAMHNIMDEVKSIDDCGVFWKKGER